MSVKRTGWGAEPKRRQMKYVRSAEANGGARSNGRLEVVDVRELGMERVVGFAHMQFFIIKHLSSLNK